MGLFINFRKPKKFEHKPIYYDPRKDALAKRIEKVRRQMIEDGELAPDQPIENSEESKEKRHEELAKLYEEDIHKGLRRTMVHLPRQESKGKAGSGRMNEIFRILIFLLLLVAVVWVLYYRK